MCENVSTMDDEGRSVFRCSAYQYPRNLAMARALNCSTGSGTEVSNRDAIDLGGRPAAFD